MRIRKKPINLALRLLLWTVVIFPLYADFKIMGGMNISWYDVSPESANIQWDYKRGFSAGIGLEKILNPFMLLELDILYFQKGSQAEYSDFQDSEAKYKLNVLSLPLLFRSKFLYNSSPYVVGGVEFSSILSHEFVTGGEEPVDLKNDTRSFDFGFVLGCGFEIKIEDRLFFFVEGRYHLGFRNIMANPFLEETKKTRAILILIGLRS
jgi:hypothetical protein